jgi:hypothetical protein
MKFKIGDKVKYKDSINVKMEEPLSEFEECEKNLKIKGDTVITVCFYEYQLSCGLFVPEDKLELVSDYYKKVDDGLLK